MGRFLKWIVNIILLCAIVIAAALLIPPLAGVTTAMIDEVDMDTNLPRGSVTYARDVAADDLEAGDDVLILESGKTYVYRVKNLDTGDGTCTLEDTRTAGAEEVTRTFTGDVSKVVLTVPFIGYIPMAMKSTEGLIVIGLAVVFVIILFILAELWRPDRDDEEEEEEEENPEPADEARQTLPVDTPSQIMEEASSEIASVVSSVVAEESQPEEIRQPEEDGELDEIDRKLRQEPEYLSEEEVLRQAEETDGTVTADGEEDAAILSLEEDIRSEEERMQEINDGAQEEIVLEQETVPEEESAVEETVIEEAALLEEPVSEEETMETAEEMTEEKIPAAEPYVPEQEVEEEVQTDERKLAMPLYTADELLAKAREKGENPRVVKDEKTGVTLLDYSDLL
ncbi:MAG TPA: hypothetical protein IAA03_07140 [Candidatus Ruminococcus avistercoris]|nr:hypothetical protein [Candidatus Ruminococcus avistercoris]